MSSRAWPRPERLRPKSVQRCCPSAMGRSRPPWLMPLRAGRLRPSARLASASPWLGAVRRKRRRRLTTGASEPEGARSRNTTELSGAPQQSNQDALDLVVAAVVELGRAGRGLVGDHCPLHSCGFSRLPSLPPPLAQGRVVARL